MVIHDDFLFAKCHDSRLLNIWVARGFKLLSQCALMHSESFRNVYCQTAIANQQRKPRRPIWPATFLVNEPSDGKPELWSEESKSAFFESSIKNNAWGVATRDSNVCPMLAALADKLACVLNKSIYTVSSVKRVWRWHLCRWTRGAATGTNIFPVCVEVRLPLLHCGCIFLNIFAIACASQGLPGPMRHNAPYAPPSLTHPVPRPLTPSLAHSPRHPLPHSRTHAPTSHPPTHSPTHSTHLCSYGYSWTKPRGSLRFFQVQCALGSMWLYIDTWCGQPLPGSFFFERKYASQQSLPILRVYFPCHESWKFPAVVSPVS